MSDEETKESTPRHLLTIRLPSSESDTYESALDVGDRSPAAEEATLNLPSAASSSGDDDGVYKFELPVTTCKVEFDKYYPFSLRHIFQHPQARVAHRFPWMTEYQPYFADLTKGSVDHALPVPLFDCSTIRSSPVGEDHETFCIDSYFYDRFIASKGVDDQKSSPRKHLGDWNRFVKNFNKSPSAWIARLRLNEDAFFKSCTKTAMMIKVHCICAAYNLHCAVEFQYGCPMCYSSSKKLYKSEHKRVGAPRVLLEALAVLEAVMKADLVHVSDQISEIKNGNRKRDLRISKLEEALKQRKKQA